MPSSFGGLGGQVFGRGGIGGLGVGRAPVSLKTVVPAKPQRWILYGVTKDYLGATLGGCTLEAIESANGVPITAYRTNGSEPKGRLVNMTVSNSVGAYKLDVHSVPGVLFQVDAYLSGSPDRAGTTVNTLAANLDTDFY